MAYRKLKIVVHDIFHIGPVTAIILIGIYFINHEEIVFVMLFTYDLQQSLQTIGDNNELFIAYRRVH